MAETQAGSNVATTPKCWWARKRRWRSTGSSLALFALCSLPPNVGVSGSTWWAVAESKKKLFYQSGLLHHTRQNSFIYHELTCRRSVVASTTVMSSAVPSREGSYVDSASLKKKKCLVWESQNNQVTAAHGTFKYAEQFNNGNVIFIDICVHISVSYHSR